ncbi:hypothetical protein L596_014208 [Steinernema carpocapsae]|uniref:Uncharacterized protein n=1 Tax=Steinernema carpocapsae TaxID=34508 RepID=A0A4U5NBE7_STECR|nr:hypothetical protein L596_014208 [Steinernema carpocapsae]
MATEDKQKKKRKRRFLRGKEVVDSEVMNPSEERNRQKSSIAMVNDLAIQVSSEDSDEETVCAQCNGPCLAEDIEKTDPPVISYIGTSPTICHMMKQKRPICCLQVDQPCRHCNFLTASQYNWKNPAVIVAVDKTSSGLYNLFIPLRAYYRPIHELQPIILLLELDEGRTRKNETEAKPSFLGRDRLVPDDLLDARPHFQSRQPPESGRLPSRTRRGRQRRYEHTGRIPR